MPATSAKKTRKPAVSEAVSTPVVPLLASGDVLAWLQANPGFFTEHAAALGTLAQPAKGGNILSLHALKERRTAHRAEQLAVRHKQVVAAARSNALTAQTLMGQMAVAVAQPTLAAFRTYVQTTLKTALELDAVRLMLAGDTTSATTLAVAEIEELCPQSVNLRTLHTADERALYGVKGKLVRSDCLLKLAAADGRVVGVLGLGSEDAARFHIGQESQMAEAFGAVLGASLGRLLG